MAKLQTENNVALRIENVCKRFGGVIASDDVSFELRYGEVFGLIGPNGSGKTTLINLITGIYKVDSGKIIMPSGDITKMSIHGRAREGIIRTFQHPRLLEDCDLRTNIYVGMDLARKRGKKQDRVLLDRLMDAANLNVDLNVTMDKLSYGQQKLLEIVRAILAEPSVLLLDEPAAGLNHKEMDYIRELIDIALERRTAVLLIEHAMDFVMDICDRITVLNFGHQIASGVPSEIQTNLQVIEAYLGRSHNA
mgnify:FL=1